MNRPSKRLLREKRTVTAMLQIYCRNNHDPAKQLCASCADLNQYAEMRLQACPFGAAKTVCSKCQVHCYSTAKRARIRKIMRYAGPRMLWSHPVLTLFHFWDKRREEPLANLGVNIIESEARN